MSQLSELEERIEVLSSQLSSARTRVRELEALLNPAPQVEQQADPKPSGWNEADFEGVVVR